MCAYTNISHSIDSESRRTSPSPSMAGDGVADWMALPDDLIKKFGDIYLSTNDLDYYAIFRAVCGA